MSATNAPTYPGNTSAERALTPLKGAFHINIVDFHSPLSTNVNIGGVGTPPQAGQVVHYTASGFEMGANLTKMPIFLWQGYSDYDVQNRGVSPSASTLGGSSTYKPGWIPVRPTGVLSGLVAIGGYELETTEFDTAQTYAPNQLLRAVTSNTNANAGKLTNQDASGGAGFATSAALTLYTDSAVGVVSRGSYTNANGFSALAFWPVYLPGTR